MYLTDEFGHMYTTESHTNIPRGKIPEKKNPLHHSTQTGHGQYIGNSITCLATLISRNNRYIVRNVAGKESLLSKF
jgi:hypothetical protein